MRSLEERLLDWMDGATGEAFDSFSLEVFRDQFHRNDPYRRYAEARRRTPDNVDSWLEIPAIPTDAFKFPLHPLRCFPEEETTAIFRTSGTTRDVRGEHAFRNLNAYEHSILKGWETAALPRPDNPWFLSQSPVEAPDSSLVHMFSTLGKAHADDLAGRWLIDGDGAIQIEPLIKAASGKRPIVLFSTALALVRLMEGHPPLALPTGSWVFETGGYKGVNVQLNPADFKTAVAAHFSIPSFRILNEYGMTEISSPFYAWNGEASHRGSPWVRIRVVDPDTNRLAKAGEPGYLEIIDLANLDSVIAIRTQDLAIATGDSSFTLLGRDPGALPRGCSRRSDDLLSSSP